MDAFDIDDRAVTVLRKKYHGNSRVRIAQKDTLLDEELTLFCAAGGRYDKIVGNPPYGAWQEYDRRALLKKKYPGQYVRETYSLFLLRCVSLLKTGGRLSFIVPDTFLFLNMHTKLREFLLTSTKISEILTFPSKFFPGVSFGYSKLAIVTLERAARGEALKNSVRMVRGFRSAADFVHASDSAGMPAHLESHLLNQQEILQGESCRFLVADRGTAAVLQDAPVRIGDVARVVTGFCSGDNRRFVRALDDSVKGSKNYEKIVPDRVFSCTSLDGIETEDEGYVPYVKNVAGTRYCRTRDEWFVRWDRKALDFYRTSPKTRFQNAAFYFRRGIGIPMVKSTATRAILLEDRLFDQSVVGIFPHDMKKLHYLLAVMNSDAVNRLIHVINPTANNSANYIKQIPYMEPERPVLEEIGDRVRAVLDCVRLGKSGEAERLHGEINAMIGQVYGSLQPQL
ncbi:MAG: N-6 DNA methylase [Desulfovibrionaceae bacterium]|nr:N-6 DNA methylase [Desulfovibrionaceae bacterium]